MTPLKTGYLTILLPIILGWNGTLLHAQETRYLSRDYEFETGSTEYLFANKVVFRSKPSVTSAPLDTLPIDAVLTIIKKTSVTQLIGKNTSHWYEVSCNGQTGYIPDHFIALDRVTAYEDVYLVRFNQNEPAEGGVIEYRMVLPGHRYLEGKVPARTYSFGARAHNDRGLDGIESMLQILFYAEACGVNGGSRYIFHTNGGLQEVADLSSISDAGIFWFNETLVFPKDEDDEHGVIFYVSEHGEYMDEDMNWEEIKTVRRRITWQGDHFEPSIEEIQQD